MDIPNSGAIFTLGKSYLAENTQSYFYIKNDPVKRLISGPHQSAVICDSGRLFVWGENHFGQLGIGTSHNHNAADIDITTKPTCVKTLKVLGVKVRDVAYGNDWSVIVTFSNEVFYAGRSIFADTTNVATHFITTTILGEECDIARRPFRLEDFDNFLSTSEEIENFVGIYAGNEHFVVLTSFGRLIGWGSNKSQQLGALPNDSVDLPHELKLDDRVQQVVCGPESTLVLTENGSLFLSGQLNDFMFPQFTELQKHLAGNEHIVTMHISKASEIFIVTNAGSIYRSYESVRNKSLIFQRFYDYDSEEHGPIWKLLKGFSFYAVLTKANKFYTTFSESGHHLKTFREISKFKNLRLLDMAVGNQHVLVHGIPRSSTLSATMNGNQSFLGKSFVMLNGNEAKTMPDKIMETPSEAEATAGAITANEEASSLAVTNEAAPNDANANEAEANKPNAADDVTNGNAQLHETAQLEQQQKEMANIPAAQENIENEALDVAEADKALVEQLNATAIAANELVATAIEAAEIEATAPPAEAMPVEEPPIVKEIAQTLPATAEAASPPKTPTATDATAVDSSTDTNDLLPESKVSSASTVLNSPTTSIKSIKSQRSIKFDARALQKSGSGEKLLRPHTPYPDSSSSSTTPQTIKKTPLRNFSYETAMQEDLIERTSPITLDSLENIEEHAANEPSPIKAIVSAPTPPSEEDEHLVVEINSTTDELNRTVVNEIRFINNGVDVTDNVKAHHMESIESLDETDDESEQKITDTAQQLLQTNMDNMSATANEAVAEIAHTEETFSDKINGKLSDARESVETAAKQAAQGAQGAVEAAGENVKRVAHDAKHAVEAMATHATQTAADAKNSVESTFKNVVDDTKQALGTVSAKISNEMHDAKENLTKFLTHKSDADSKEHTPSSTDGDGVKTNTEDDERTTASVNSNQTSAGNPFDSNNPFDQNNPFETNELDDIVERSKRALRAEVEATEQRVAQQAAVESEQAKGKVRQFLDDVRAKGRSMSCQNDKAIRIDDELPRYTEADELAVVPHSNANGAGAGSGGGGGGGGGNGNHANTSRVCSIL